MESVTGDAWLDGVLGFNSAPDPQATVTAATQATNAIQAASTTKASGGSFSDFLYSGANKIGDYLIARDQAQVKARTQVTQAQAAALQNQVVPGLSIGPGAALLVIGIIALVALRK